MKKTLLIVLFASLLLSSCLVSGTGQQPTAQPTSDLEALVAAALAETQQAAVEGFSPALPYSPAEIALLVEPGDLLDGGWMSSTTYDLTQPYPPLGEMCGGYYGGCVGYFPDFLLGAEVELVRDGDQLGEVVFLYIEDIEALDQFYQARTQERLELDETYGSQDYNKIWLESFNRFQRDSLGEKWFHEAGFGLYDLPGSTLENRLERELLRIRISVFECHGYLMVEVRYPAENPWDSSEDNSQARQAEQEARFDLVYDYTRTILERLHPYACNP